MRVSEKKLVVAIVFLIIGMFLLAYASVPLYRLFCKATGFGGTPRIVSEGVQTVGTKEIIVQFDVNVDQKLPWKFEAEKRKVVVKPGQNTLVYFKVENTTNDAVEGTATFNVTPDKAGSYFNKIECFCFTKQTLGPKEKAVMPLVFFLDPAIENDPSTKNIQIITLSYTFFKVKTP